MLARHAVLVKSPGATPSSSRMRLWQASGGATVASEWIRVSDARQCRWIEIDRVDKRNALAVAMLEALIDAYTNVPAGTRLICLAAAGDQTFCAGADVGELRASPAAAHQQEHGLNALAAAIEAAPAPTACLTFGKVLGGALLLPCLSDVVLARADTLFKLTEIEFGAYPAPVHAALAPRIPAQLLYQMAISGRGLDATGAASLGLVTEVLPVDNFAAAARDRTAWYARRGGALRLGRKVRGLGFAGSALERIALVEDDFATLFQSDEVRELLAERFPAKPATVSTSGS